MIDLPHVVKARLDPGSIAVWNYRCDRQARLRYRNFQRVDCKTVHATRGLRYFGLRHFGSGVGNARSKVSKPALRAFS